MRDEKRRNLFEEHIESESFDLSKLEHTDLDLAQVHRQVKQLLDSLPQPLDHRIWDDALDDNQKEICAYLVTELVDSVMRPNFEEELSNLDDDQIIYVLTLPVALAMVAQKQLADASPTTPPNPIQDAASHPLTPNITLKPADNPEWAIVLGEVVRNIGARLRAMLGWLFKRP